MKDKLFSGIIGIIVGIILLFSYNHFFASGNSGSSGGANTERNMESGEMTDEQLVEMAEKTGLSVEEIEAKIESGESIRDLMGGDTSSEGGRPEGGRPDMTN